MSFPLHFLIICQLLPPQFSEEKKTYFQHISRLVYPYKGKDIETYARKTFSGYFVHTMGLKCEVGVICVSVLD